MRRLLLITTFFAAFAACKSDKSANSLPADPCLRIDQTLIGQFSNPIMDGTMLFSGGINGSVDISGRDYNDITCTYKITDCSSGIMSMVCDGSAYDAEFEIFTRDSIRVDAMYYSRVK